MDVSKLSITPNESEPPIEDAADDIPPPPPLLDPAPMLNGKPDAVAKLDEISLRCLLFTR